MASMAGSSLQPQDLEQDSSTSIQVESLEDRDNGAMARGSWSIGDQTSSGSDLGVVDSDGDTASGD